MGGDHRGTMLLQGVQNVRLMHVAEWLRLWTLAEVDAQARSPLLLVDPPSSCCGHLLLTAPRCSSFHRIALGYQKLPTWEAIASPPPTPNN